jgi:hypothetical protein
MHDGTKIRAQAGTDTFRREGTLRANREKARAVVEQMANPDAAPGATKRQQSARDRLDRVEAAL